MKWTPEREQTLRDMWLDRTPQEVADTLGVSVVTAYVRARKLNISRRKPENKTPENALTQEERAQLVTDHTPLCKSQAWARCRTRPERFDDYMQIAMIGAHRASLTWDADKGAFSTHATWIIRAEFKDYFKLLKIQGRDATTLDAPLSDGQMTRVDLLIDDSPPQDDRVYAGEAKDAIVKAMMHLTPKQRTVIKMRYLDDMLLFEIADILGVSKQAVQQLEKYSLAKLGLALADFK